MFWPWGCEESPILTTAGQNWRFFAVRTRWSVLLTIRGPVFVLACVDGGSTVASSRRWAESETLPSTPHIIWLWSPGPAASCQSFGSASVLGGNTSPGPRGAGAEGHPGMLDRRPPRGLAELWAMCRILATEVHRRLISDCNGRQTDLASSFGRGLGSMSPPLAVVFVSVHYIGLPPARVAVYAWLTVPARGGNRGRGLGSMAADAALEGCARRPFALGSWLFARVLGKRGKRGYNKWSASRLLRTLRRKG